MQSSRDVPPTGSQEPRIRIEPPRDFTFGGDAAELSAFYGSPLDEWQCFVLDSWLGRLRDGRPAAITCGLSVPRQNGKNFVIEVFELYCMVSLGLKILHTAHEVKTARKAFLRLASYFEDERRYPELARMVVSIRRTNGQEAIVLSNGASCEFSARSRGAARGFTVDIVVFDEAQELTNEQVEAMIPTMAAAPSGFRQYIYTGTPPPPGSPGDVFGRTRSAIMDGLMEHASWFEWSIEDMAGEDISSRETWAKTNPALGIRLDYEFTETEYQTLTAAGFARERLGWWSPTSVSSTAIPEDVWKATALDSIGRKFQGTKAFGLKFSPDGSEYVLAGCKMRRDRSMGAVEIVAAGSTAGGTGAIAEWLCGKATTAAAVAVDGAAAAAALCTQLEESKAPAGYVMRPGSRSVSDAAQSFLDALRAKQCWHTPAAVLDEGAASATVRKIGSGGGWGYDGSIALEAASLALWAARTTKRDPKRKQVLL